MRYWEIDVLRGVAVAGMVIYHLLVDLEMFYGLKIGVFDYPIVILARVVGTLFITLLGMSAYLQFEKEKKIRPLIKRGLGLLFWAIVVSGVTYLAFPGEYVRFGILHLLGVSLWLLVPMVYVKSKIILFLVGLGVITAGLIIRIPSPPALDYYPIMPWFGLAIWGVLIGRVYLPWRKKVVAFKTRIRFLETAGRHSLMIYLIHQPILLLCLYLANKVFFGTLK